MAINEGVAAVTMKRVWLCVLVGANLLGPATQAQNILRPTRLTHRTQFYSSPPGAMAFLPQVKASGDTEFAGQWDLLVESGRYEFDRSSQYCFVVNHCDPAQIGKRSYVAIGALSVLRSGTQPIRPISLFRNQGWSRSDNPAYHRNNGSPKHVSITLDTFNSAHKQGNLKENDRLLTHRWHGHYGDGQSWEDRDVWGGAVFGDANLIASLLGKQGQNEEDLVLREPDLRFDAKLLRFVFTKKPNSSQPVAFCVGGDRRIAVILTVFSPHFNQGERRFELVFR